MEELRRCAKCNINMSLSKKYYRSRNVEKFPPEGYLDLCKECFTMHLNVDQPSTLLPLLETLDIPYIEKEWFGLVEKYREELKSGKKSKTALFGQYVGKMRLSQYKDLRYENTKDFLEKEALNRIAEQAEKIKQVNKYRDTEYDTEHVLESLSDIDITTLTEEEIKELIKSPIEKENEEYEQITSSMYEGLTLEDKSYLLAKWGKTYSIEECLKMEKFCLEMMESYDIRSASHIDYLMKICKCSLKMDQCLDCNDLDGFNKVSKIYDMLMKAAKFQPIQTQESNDENVDAIGLMVALCEKDGFIPRYDISEPKDVVDYTIKDFDNYLRKLVVNETNLANSLEIYLNKMIQEENKEEGELDENEEWAIPKEIEEMPELTDEDYEEFNLFLEKEREIDLEALENGSDL